MVQMVLKHSPVEEVVAQEVQVKENTLLEQLGVQLLQPMVAKEVMVYLVPIMDYLVQTMVVVAAVL